VLDNLIHMMSDMRSTITTLRLAMLSSRNGFIKQDGHIALAETPSDRQIRDLFYTIQNSTSASMSAVFGQDVRSTQA